MKMKTSNILRKRKTHLKSLVFIGALDLFGSIGSIGISLKGVEIGEKNFKEEVLDSDKPVFVLFWASWCTASKRMEHTIKELKEEYEIDGSTKIKIRKVNVDKNPGLRFQHDIRQVPTYVIFNGGKIVERRIAAQSKKQLRKMIENAIK